MALDYIIHGDSRAGGTLYVEVGEGDVYDGVDNSYQWYYDDSPIEGSEQAPSITVSSDMIGKNITVIGLLGEEVVNSNIALGAGSDDVPDPECVRNPTFTIPHGLVRYGSVTAGEGLWLNAKPEVLCSWLKDGSAMPGNPDIENNVIVLGEILVGSVLIARFFPVKHNDQYGGYVDVEVGTVADGFPFEGTDYGVYCSGNNQVRRLADGVGGYTETIVQTDHASCTPGEYTAYLTGDTLPTGTMSVNSHHATNTGAVVFTTRWLVDGVAIPDQTSIFLSMQNVRSKLVGHNLSAEITLTETGKVTTTPPYLVTASATPVPVCTQAPVIYNQDGSPDVLMYSIAGVTLGKWINAQFLPTSYQWLMNGAPAPGFTADGEQYYVEEGVGKTLTVKLGMTSVGGGEETFYTTAPVGPFVARNAPLGWYLGEYCEGPDLMMKIADGAGGFISQAGEPNSPSCGDAETPSGDWLQTLQALFMARLGNPPDLEPSTMAFLMEMVQYAQAMGATATPSQEEIQEAQAAYWSLYLQMLHDEGLKYEDFQTRVMPLVVDVYKMNPNAAFGFVQLLRGIVTPDTRFSLAHREAVFGMQSLLCAAGAAKAGKRVGALVDLPNAISPVIFSELTRSMLISYFD